jgi:hypothetical protein
VKSLVAWRPDARDGAEVLLIAMTLPIYYLVRGLAHTRVDEAVDRGVGIIHLEESLGIFWEVELQAWAMSIDGLDVVLANYYLFGHLPVICVAAVWLYFSHRPQYLLLRNAFLLSGALALFFYVNYPTAPPRLLPDDLGFGFVDTVVEEYDDSRPLTPSWFVNEYAAFPSMHIGWNLLVGIALWMATKNPWVRVFAVVMPFLMFADIVLTANHYFLDAVAGAAVMAAGLALAFAVSHAGRRILAREGARFTESGWRGWACWICGIPTPGSERLIPDTT